MDNPGLNHPPEVDSLPDGFESSAEIQTPSTQISEQAKTLDCEHKTLPESDCSNGQRHEVVENFETEQCSTENTQKLETFPVALSETEKFNNSESLEKMADEGCTEQAETAILNVKETSNESSTDESGCSKIKGQAQEESQSSEKATSGGLDASTAHEKEISLTKVVQTTKNTKSESAEVKRKNPKRTFKSEKEFLEFTLKYQQVLAERDTAVVVRDKLESLCRELQRQNKMLMDECKRVSTEGQSLRTELSVKFQDAIKDVSNKLDEQKDECLAQLKENETLRNKLKQLIDQFALSEHQFAQKLKQKTLELQLADLKTKQCEEKLIQEQSQMKLYAEQISQLLATEKHLRLQLTADGEKFQQFQDALLKSNEVFETFKQEIEKNVGLRFETWNAGVLGPVTLKGLNEGIRDMSKYKWSYKVGLKGELLNLHSVRGSNSVEWAKGSGFVQKQPLTWYKTTFNSPGGNEPLALDMSSMGKGQIWVNGQSIGRYFPAYIARGRCSKCSYTGIFTENKCVFNCGQPSQKWYHIPREWLKPSGNLLIVFEEFGGNPGGISLVKRYA